MVISGSATAVSADGDITTFCAGDIFYVPQEDHDSWDCPMPEGKDPLVREERGFAATSLPVV